MLRSRERSSTENDGVVLHGLDMLNQSRHEPFGTIVAERESGIIFIAGNLIEHAKVRYAAELARSDSSLLIGLVPGKNLTDWGTARNLRLLHRFCDTTIIVDTMEKVSSSGIVKLEHSDVALRICKAVANASCRKVLRSMLGRGQLARVSSARSNLNVEEALLRALRTLLPVTEFSRKPEVFLGISGREIDRKTLARASRWISKALYPSNIIVYSTCRESEVGADVFLVATGIAFPYSPSSRKLSINLDELEPESDGDNDMSLTLGLDQIE